MSTDPSSARGSYWPGDEDLAVIQSLDRYYILGDYDEDIGVWNAVVKVRGEVVLRVPVGVDTMDEAYLRATMMVHRLRSSPSPSRASGGG